MDRTGRNDGDTATRPGPPRQEHLVTRGTGGEGSSRLSGPRRDPRPELQEDNRSRPARIDASGLCRAARHRSSPLFPKNRVAISATYEKVRGSPILSVLSGFLRLAPTQDVLYRRSSYPEHSGGGPAASAPAVQGRIDHFISKGSDCIGQAQPPQSFESG
jgi:hypothetical protein